MANENSTQAKRQTAIKINIGDLTSGRYVKATGEWDPNYILTPYNTKVSRANVLGVVVGDIVNEAGGSFTIDDGSGKLVVRSFEKINTQLKLGDVVLVIGRPREFANETYLMPEIIKHIEKNKEKWLELRKKELQTIYRDMEKTVVSQKPDNVSQTSTEKVEEEKISTHTPPSEKIEKDETSELQEEIEEKTEIASEIIEKAEQPAETTTSVSEDTAKNPFDLIMETIKKLDSDSGADIEEVIAESGITPEKAENIINNLLMDGEAFEMKPGKLKLLD